MTSQRANKFKELQILVNRIAYGDRDQLIYWAVKEKGFTLQEVADVIGMTRENVRLVVNKHKKRYGTN